MAPLRRIAAAALALPALAFARLQHLSLQPSDCVSACLETVYYLHYADSGFEYPKHDEDFYPDSCRSDLFLESLAACSNRYCDKDVIAPGWHLLELYYCTYRKKSDLAYDKWLHLSDVDGPPTMMKTLDSEQNITRPVIPVLEDFDIAYRTVVCVHYAASG